MIRALVLIALIGVQFGCWDKVQSGASSFFRVEKIDGVWWFIDPEGERFISKGVNHVSYTADHAPELGYSPYERTVDVKYGSRSSWVAAVLERFHEWNFNTIGAWSDSELYLSGMAYAPTLDIASKAGADWQKGVFADVFSNSFQETAEAVALEQCAPRRNDSHLLGYFTDNELKWGSDWRSEKGLLSEFWELGPDSPGRKAAVTFLEEYYEGEIALFNQAWNTDYPTWSPLQGLRSLTEVGPQMVRSQKLLGHNQLLNLIPEGMAIHYARAFYRTVENYNMAEGTSFASLEEAVQEQPMTAFARELQAVETAFQEQVAKRYFEVCASAIRKHDPNHLILGCRFGSYAPESVVRVSKEHVDVISFNRYDPMPPVRVLNEIHDWSGRPILLTEFGFKAMDSGLPNTMGAGLPVATQQDRADAFESYITALMGLPFVVGYHWFEYVDEPAEGRFDGENSNFGLVDIKDECWEVLTQKMREINARGEEIHQR